MKKFLLLLCLIVSSTLSMAAENTTIFYLENSSHGPRDSQIYAWFYSPIETGYTEWPGPAMTKLCDKVWFYSSSTLSPNKGMVMFNQDSTDEWLKTSARTFEDGVAYTPNGNYTAEKDGQCYTDSYSPTVILYANDGGWGDIVTLNYVSDGIFKSEATYVNFSSTEYGLKFMINGTQYAWFVTESTFTGAASTVTNASSTNGKMTLTGHYVFSFNVNDKTFSAEKQPCNVKLVGRLTNWSTNAIDFSDSYNSDTDSYTVSVDDLSNTTDYSGSEGFQILVDNKYYLGNGSSDLATKAALGTNYSLTVSGKNISPNGLAATTITVSGVSHSGATLVLSKYDLQNTFTLSNGTTELTFTKQSDGTYKSETFSLLKPSDKFYLLRESDLGAKQYLYCSSSITKGDNALAATKTQTSFSADTYYTDAYFTLSYTDDRNATLTLSGTVYSPVPALVGRAKSGTGYSVVSNFSSTGDNTYELNNVDLSAYNQYKISDSHDGSTVNYIINFGGSSDGQNVALNTETSLTKGSSNYFVFGTVASGSKYNVTLTYDGSNAKIKYVPAEVINDFTISAGVDGQMSADGETYTCTLATANNSMTITRTNNAGESVQLYPTQSYTISDLSSALTISLTEVANNNTITFSEKIANVVCKLVYNSTAKTATLTMTGETYVPRLYLVGENITTSADGTEYGKWKCIDSYKFSRVTNKANTYTLTVPAGVLSGNFKIADGVAGSTPDWQYINIGGTVGSDQTVSFGANTIQANTNSSSLVAGSTNMKDNELVLTLVYSAMGSETTLTIEPKTMSYSYALVVAGTSYAMSLESGHIHTYQLDAGDIKLAAGKEFYVVRTGNDDSSTKIGAVVTKNNGTAITTAYDVCQSLGNNVTLEIASSDIRPLTVSKDIPSATITFKNYGEDDMSLIVKEAEREAIYLCGKMTNNWAVADKYKFEYLGSNQYKLHVSDLNGEFKILYSSSQNDENYFSTTNSETLTVSQGTSYTLTKSKGLKTLNFSDTKDVDIYLYYDGTGSTMTMSLVESSAGEGDVRLIFLNRNNYYSPTFASIRKSDNTLLYPSNAEQTKMYAVMNNWNVSYQNLWAYSFKANSEYDQVNFHGDGSTLADGNVNNFVVANQEIKDGYIYRFDDIYKSSSSTSTLGDKTPKKARIVIHYGYNGEGDTWGDGIEFSYLEKGVFAAKNVRLAINCNFGFKVGYYEQNSTSQKYEFNQLGWMTGSSLSINDSNVEQGIQLNSPIPGTLQDNNGLMELNGYYNLYIDMSDTNNIRLYGEKLNQAEDVTAEHVRVVSNSYGHFDRSSVTSDTPYQLAVEVLDDNGHLQSTRSDRYRTDYQISKDGVVVLSTQSTTAPYISWDLVGDSNSYNGVKIPVGEYTVYVRVTDINNQEEPVTLYFSSYSLVITDSNDADATASAVSADPKSGYVYFENTAGWDEVHAALGISSSTVYKGVKNDAGQLETLQAGSDGRIAVSYVMDGITYNRVIFFTDASIAEDDNASDYDFDDFYATSDFSTGKIHLVDNAVYNAKGEKLNDVYFQDDASNKIGDGKVYVYMWNKASADNSGNNGENEGEDQVSSTVKNAVWPGEEATLIDSENLIYRYTYQEDSSTPLDGIIFNGGSGDSKTGDLTTVIGALYNKSGVVNAKYAQSLITNDINVVDEKGLNNSFYISGLSDSTNHTGSGTLEISGSKVEINGVDQDVIYAWVKFENFSYNGKNYDTGENNWTREKSADNATVKECNESKLKVVCFNPSYYRVYMFTSATSASELKTSASQTSAPRKVVKKADAADATTTTDTEDHGAQPDDIGVNSYMVVAFTSNVVNSNGLTTSVADIILGEEDGPVEYYNLSGMRLPNADNLTPGVYIMRRGQKAVKVLIK